MIKTIPALLAEITRLTERAETAERENVEYQRRSELNPLLGYSCNGINVWGDEASMKAVRKAIAAEPFQEQVIAELRNRLAALDAERDAGAKMRERLAANLDYLASADLAGSGWKYQCCQTLDASRREVRDFIVQRLRAALEPTND